MSIRRVPSLVLTPVMLLALASVATAQAPQPGSAPAASVVAASPVVNVDQMLETIRAKHGVPGLAAVLVVGDTLRFEGATGVRAEGSSERVTTSDLWHIGSDTKAMTATLCARLVEKGVLSWSTTLDDAFPELAAAMDPAWLNVTLEQLCTNRGGVPADLNADGLWGRLWEMSNKNTPARDARRELLLGVTKNPPAYEPGSKFVYSNGGFAIAGHIAETKAGKPWEDLIRDELFTPLGITRAGFGAPGTKDTIDQPRGHRGKAAPFKPVAPGPGADNPSAIGPAGTVHIALADWARFVAAHAQGETGAGAAGGFLKPESWKKLHTPLGGKNPNDGYAMGWGITTRPWAKGTREGDVGRVFTHAGSNTMWFAVAWIAPEKNLSILIACNAAGESGPKAADEAAQAMIKALQTAESSGATSSPANPSPETKR